MREHPAQAEVQRWGCGMLRNLACSAGFRTGIVLLGGVEAVCRSMWSNLDSADVQCWACTALGAFVQEDGARKKLTANSGIAVLREVMHEHLKNAEIQRLGRRCAGHVPPQARKTLHL